MGNKKGRRQFGNIRRLASGRYQASYLGLDGLRRTADHTFDTKTDANNWLTVKQSELLRGDWIDPNRGRITLDEYSRRWLAERPLGDRTRDRYASLLRLHVLPLLGSKSLSEITTDVVRSWRHELSERGRGNGTVVKSYRLLRAILSTAVDDERIRRNPCRIKGADKEGSPERPVASIPQVFALATLVPSRFRVLVLMAGFTGLRWGELAGLRRTDVDLTNGYVHVRRNLKQLDSGRLVEGPPKSAAGYRRVALPSELVDDLRAHLDEYAAEPTARVFTGAGGGDLRRDNWHRDVDWKGAIQRAGLRKLRVGATGFEPVTPAL